MAGWALDLGTTNSGIARCDDTGQPQLVELVAVCRDPERDDPLEAPRMVPSAVHVLERPGLVDRLGGWPPVARRLFLGRRALIGQRALDRNRYVALPAFAPTFKAALASEATRPLARVGRRHLSAREVASTCASCSPRRSAPRATGSGTWSSPLRSRLSRPTAPRCSACSPTSACAACASSTSRWRRHSATA